MSSSGEGYLARLHTSRNRAGDKGRFFRHQAINGATFRLPGNLPG
ncbi:MAG: hypothetical protein AB1801_16400 [Chloroflexota bacterium]